MKNMQKLKAWWSLLLILGVVGATQVACAQPLETELASEFNEEALISDPVPLGMGEDEKLDYIDTYPGKLVPFVGMAVAVLIVWIVMGMVRATDRHRHETIRQYLEKGVEVPWELLVDDGNPQTWKPVSDLRKATVWLALGLGLGLTAWIFSGNPKSLALGLIFDFIGLGYLIVWKLEPKQLAEDKARH